MDNISTDEVMRRTLQRTEIIPENIEIKFAYNGPSAARYTFFSVLAQEMFNIDEEEAAKYLVRLGVETMRSRIAAAYSVVGIPEDIDNAN